MHISVYPWNGGRGLQRLPLLTYYNILKWESRLTFGLNAAKHSDYIKKCFEQKLFRIKVPIKDSLDAYLYLPQK